MTPTYSQDPLIPLITRPIILTFIDGAAYIVTVSVLIYKKLIPFSEETCCVGLGTVTLNGRWMKPRLLSWDSRVNNNNN